MPTYVLNDETKVNSHKFRVPNKGIDFSRFDANPAMLADHDNSLKSILGEWENRRFEGVQLKMDTKFDSEDPNVKPIEEKADRGFIKGASMGLGFDWENMVYNEQDEVWELVKCELMEGSLCAVPSNSNALALYDKTGRIIPEDEIKLSMQKLTLKPGDINNEVKMEKIILSHQALSVLVGLGLSAENVSAAEISNALIKLQGEVDNTKTKLTAAEGKVAKLEGEVKEQAKLQAEALIDGAIAEGKLTAKDRDEYVENAIGNYKLTASLISKIPGKSNLAGKLNNSTASQSEVKNADDFEKLTGEQKLAWKEANPEAYKALWSK